MNVETLDDQLKETCQALKMAGDEKKKVEEDKKVVEAKFVELNKIYGVVKEDTEKSAKKIIELREEVDNTKIEDAENME